MHTRFPLQVYARPDIMLSTEKCHKYKLKSYLKLTEDAIALSWPNFSHIIKDTAQPCYHSCKTPQKQKHVLLAKGKLLFVPFIFILPNKKLNYWAVPIHIQNLATLPIVPLHKVLISDPRFSHWIAKSKLSRLLQISIYLQDT